MHEISGVQGAGYKTEKLSKIVVELGIRHERLIDGYRETFRSQDP
jgi:hypothetical protein